MPRRLSDYALLLLAISGGGYGIWGLRQPWAAQRGSLWLWGLLVGAACIGGFALRRMEAWVPDGQPAARPVALGTARQRRQGIVCLGAAVAVTAAMVAWLWPNYREWHGAPWLWLAALALTIIGGWRYGGIGEPAVEFGSRRAPDSDALPRAGWPRWLEVAAFVAVAALAVGLRTWRLDEIPAGIYVDETNGALDSLYVLEGRGDSPFGTGWYETPNGYAYYMAALFKIFGANYYSLKAASIVPAVLTVFAMYPLGRLLFGPVTGLAAMLLVAVSRWHLTMSRWGWNETSPPVFQVLATFFLIRGLRERRALDYTLGGLIAGLTVYTYLSSRLALATLGLFGVYWVLTDPDGVRAGVRRHRAGLALYLVAAVIAMAPIAVTYIRDPFTFNNRMMQISVFNEVRETHSYRPLIDNIVRHLMFFHFRGDESGKHNLPGEPETDPITGLFFAIGLGYGLMRPFDRRRGLLWLWVVFAMVGGVFSVRHEAPQAYRTLNAVPAIALFAADALVRLACGFACLWPARGTARVVGSWMAGAAVAAGLSGAALWETRLYFGEQATSPMVRGSFNLTENWATKDVLAALTKGDAVYLSPRFYDFSPLRFLVYGVMKAKDGRNTLDQRAYRLARPEIDLPIPDTGQDALYLVDSYYWPLREYFARFYPNAKYDLVTDLENRPLYMRVVIPQAQLAAVQGLHLRVSGGAGPAVERVVPSIEAGWGGSDGARAEWSGGIRVDRSGEYDFLSEGALAVVVDEVAWTGTRFLGRGLHSLRVTQEAAQRKAGARLSWKGPNGSAEPVPATALFRIGPPHEGLMATYYPNKDWSGEPRFSQITPFLLLAWPDGEPFLPPFSARFTGTLRIETPGTYHFMINADDGARFKIDGKVLGEGMEPLRPNQIRTNPILTAGDHRIELEYVQVGGSNALEFYWRPPNGVSEPVPPRVLVPGPR